MFQGFIKLIFTVQIKPITGLVMINYAGKLIHVKSSEQDYHFDKGALQDGFNTTNDFIIHKQGEEVKYVINRICDHNGGKLIPKNNMATCPLHGWKLNLETLEYSDSFIKKNTLPFPVYGNHVTVKQPVYTLEMQLDGGNEAVPANAPPVEVVFLSHACIYIEAGDFSMITDPWLMGSAFMNGWWLQNPPKQAAWDYAKKAKMLYISHNHPDHLHPETITRLINKDTFTITGGFASGSSEEMLKRTGMNNVHPLPFKDVYQWKAEPIYFSVIKSGDFRDDSGIYLNIYGFEILMTVDSNFINGYILPKKLDLLFTAFASGASGYPLCFESLTKEEKERVLKRNIAAEMIKVSDIIKKTNPAIIFLMPGILTPKPQGTGLLKTITLKITLKIPLLTLKRPV